MYGCLRCVSYLITDRSLSSLDFFCTRWLWFILAIVRAYFNGRWWQMSNESVLRRLDPKCRNVIAIAWVFLTHTQQRRNLPRRSSFDIPLSFPSRLSSAVILYNVLWHHLHIHSPTKSHPNCCRIHPYVIDLEIYLPQCQVLMEPQRMRTSSNHRRISKKFSLQTLSVYLC